MMIFDEYGCFGYGGRGPQFKSGDCRKTKNPACFAGEQGSRKIDDLCEIVNYLLASLVGVSPAKLADFGWILLACASGPRPVFPTRKDISAQRDHSVPCGNIGYVLCEFIGSECIAL
jgi:hypothetical protein